MAQQYGITDGWQWISGKQPEPKPDHPAGFTGTRTFKSAMKFETFEAAHTYANQERLTKEGWLPVKLPEQLAKSESTKPAAPQAKRVPAKRKVA